MHMSRHINMTFPNETRAVWVEVGVWKRSNFVHQLAADPSLFLIAIEPTQSSALSSARELDFKARGRYVMVQSACTALAWPSTLTFYEHPDSECNSLNLDNPVAAPVDAGKCVGGRSRSRSVPVVTLAQVLQRIPLSLQIPLLKIDIQGREWPCLDGAGPSLRRIDNILIEIQDLHDWGRAMYQNSHNASFLDSHLGEHGFVRQFCELNGPGGKLGRNSHVREVNCMYTQRSRDPLLASSAQGSGAALVEPWRGSKPSFHKAWFLTTLASTPEANALDTQLRALGLKLHTPNVSVMPNL